MGVGERQGLPLSCRLLTGVTLAETSPDDVDSRHSGLARLFGDGSLAVRSSLLGLVDGWTASALALFDGVQPSRPDEPGTRLPPVGPSGDRGARHIECGLPRHSPHRGQPVHAAGPGAACPATPSSGPAAPPGSPAECSATSGSLWSGPYSAGSQVVAPLPLGLQCNPVRPREPHHLFVLSR